MKTHAMLAAISLICLLASPSGGQPRLASSDAGTRLAAFIPPGACVPVPSRNFLLRRTITQSSPPDPAREFVRHDQVSMGTSRPFDLDGDGQSDTLVPEPAQGDCTQDYHFAIYVTRGTCGHRVGLVHGSIDVVAMRTAPRHAGLPDLTTIAERQQQPDPRIPAVLRRETHAYRFDGTAYREIHSTVVTPVCHHCPDARCENSVMTP